MRGSDSKTGRPLRRPDARRGRARALAADSRGVAAAEFALCLPFVTALLLGIYDFGNLAYTYMQVHAAAHAGAQWVLANGPSCTVASVQNAVTGSVSATVTATPAPSCGVSECVTTAGALTAPTNSTCPTSTTNGDAPGTYALINAKATVTSLAPWSSFVLPSSVSATAAVRYQ